MTTFMGAATTGSIWKSLNAATQGLQHWTPDNVCVCGQCWRRIFRQCGHWQGPPPVSGGPAGFSVKGSTKPASASLLLLLAGDVETNPGPGKRPLSVPARNVLTLSRSVSGGTPENLLEWVKHKPEILKGISNVALLVGGNSVCTKWGHDEPRSTPTLTTQQYSILSVT